MYLNDHARSPFYESLGLNTKQFNQHVILETNKTTERIFPEVPDVEDAAFFPRLDRMVALAERLTAIGGSDAPGPLKTLQKVPVFASFVGELLAMFFSPVKSTGSADLVPEVQAVY
jgi:magnesium-protoporphyrin IX monomethyl ester (oxidative) cyclase